ncbi:MAG TPA: M20/M25/M40 family metallo-hydrolase [Microvirga sp.]|jgi:Zn-dependent M28 family amino/carboxypeptidase
MEINLLGSLALRSSFAAALLSLAAPGLAVAAVGVSPAPDPFRHIEALYDIAAANRGTRASGTPGYDASADYVAGQLRAAGYEVRFETFSFPFFEERSKPVLSSGGVDHPADALRTLAFSGVGEVTAPVHAVDLALDNTPLAPSTSGCEAEDFAGFEKGKIALVRRGTCPFQVKVERAQEAGAAAIIIMNQGTEGQDGTFPGRLASPARIPVLGVSTSLGRSLAEAAAADPAASVRLKIDVESGTRETRNVLAQRGAGQGPVVVIGAHLDSVPEGPGMNDNASGTAAVLDAALRLASDPAAPRLRFAFWGAEERGLLGSRHHLTALPEDERARIGLYVNLDMVGSPNPGRFVQLTQNEPTGLAAPFAASLKAYFDGRGLPLDERAGRPRGYGSDDAAFAARQIPTVGLFTGAGERKSEEHASRFGGEAGKPFDPCYHQSCDMPANIDRAVLRQITDALTLTLGQIGRDLPAAP